MLRAKQNGHSASLMIIEFVHCAVAWGDKGVIRASPRPCFVEDGFIPHFEWK